jgi:hypothetical protein
MGTLLFLAKGYLVPFGIRLARICHVAKKAVKVHVCDMVNPRLGAVAPLVLTDAFFLGLKPSLFSLKLSSDRTINSRLIVSLLCHAVFSTLIVNPAVSPTRALFFASAI